MKPTSLLAVAASLLQSSLVAAHGYVQSGVINGVTYTGYLPFSDLYEDPPPSRIFRPVEGNDPITDITSIDLQCGGYQNSGTTPAKLLAPVAAGSTMSLSWTTWPTSHKGAIVTYMAKCPGDCTAFLPGSSAVWFKIAQSGKAADGTWASVPLETNVPVKVTIPAKLAPGNYVVRHELWSLHLATTYPGAQIWPSCFQVTVTGTGTSLPAASNMVSIPGAYTSSTPGVIWNILTNTAAYPIPGPAVWAP